MGLRVGLGGKDAYRIIGERVAREAERAHRKPVGAHFPLELVIQVVRGRLSGGAAVLVAGKATLVVPRPDSNEA